ncbi:alpha/beta hydrolase [Streptomyces parvulus]|uniref:alpha/beta hydrolase n=1 Tax=Streptomyces parvulus TaxID=146923 RepID=UPI0033BCC38C
MEDWGPLEPAVANVWKAAAELIQGDDFERLESEVLASLRTLEAARQATVADGSPTPEAYEEIDSAARKVAALFEAHAPLGAMLAIEFDALSGGQELFGPEAPPPHWVEWQRSLLVPVLYATDRAPGPEGTGFGADRGELSYGDVRVGIPDDHRMGAAERPKPWRLRFRDDPAKVATLGAVANLTPAEFTGLARSRLAECQVDQALLFIHGYNVTFVDASVRAAQIAYDLNFTGLPMFYSWPSKGTVAGYIADENAVSRAVPYFRDFLNRMLTETGVGQLHILAHSMGNRLLTEALADFDTASLPPGSGRLGQLIFAAPDVDAEVFKQRLPRIARQTAGLTLYASSNDRALAASRKLAAAPRAGQVGPGIVVVPGMDTIDATALDTGLMGHSYVGDHTSVLADVYGMLRQNLTPSVRFGLVPMPHADGAYWAFRPQH